MEHQPPDFLSQLATELRCTVARFIDNPSDRKALMLVNKTWAETVAPFLWETLTTDLIQSGQRNLLGLAHPQSNIIKHVRNINLLDRSLFGNVDHLPTLLAAIPRNQLQGFQSASQMQQSTLGLLLLLHPKLEILNIPGDGALANAVQSAWTTGCLSNLTSLSIYVDYFTSEGFQKLWNECPNLIRLNLLRHTTSAAVIHENAFLPGPPWMLPLLTKKGDDNSHVQVVEPLKLEYLQIGNITLPKRLDTMFQRIDVLALCELSLCMFAGASELLGALAIKFTGNHPCLKKLCITRLAEQASQEFSTNLLLLLTSFCGLQHLRVQCANCDKIDVDGIVNHGETLQTLYITNGGIHRADPSKCFDALDLQKIATACPELAQLCLNLYEIDPDRNESDILGPQPGVSFTPNEFEQGLCAIAAMPKLRILRFTNLPNYRKAYHLPGEFARFFRRTLQSGVERQGFQARADGVMRYLGEHGSNIMVLAFSPVEAEKLKRADYPDKNGHVWPDYFYYRGRLTDYKGIDMAVARPLVNWKVEFPGATVLDDL